MFLQNIVQIDSFMVLLFHLTSDQNLEETGNKKKCLFYQQWQNDQPEVKVILQVQEQKINLLLQH